MNRALQLMPDRDMAILAVAQAFNTRPETVRAVVDPVDGGGDSEGGDCDVAAAA